MGIQVEFRHHSRLPEYGYTLILDVVDLPLKRYVRTWIRARRAQAGPFVPACR